jgi:hypothetical protein
MCSLSHGSTRLCRMQTFQSQAFDFIYGHWIVHNRQLRNVADPMCEEWVEFDAESQFSMPEVGMREALPLDAGGLREECGECQSSGQQSRTDFSRRCVGLRGTSGAQQDSRGEIFR